MRSNDEFYLKEAFQKLQLLNEDSFDLTTADIGVVDELQSFVADDIEAPFEEVIIDVEADNVDELKDSYLGKVILQCNCCNSKVYKNDDEVVIDEESDCANIEEECPVCGNAFGWSVIGKIEPFEENKIDTHEDEVDASVEEAEFTEDEVSEAIKEALSIEEDVNSVRNKVSDYLLDAMFELNDNLAYRIADAVKGYNPEWCEADGWSSLVNVASYAEGDYVEALLDILFANAPRQESFNEDVDIHVDTTEDGVKVEVEKEENDTVVVEDDSVEEIVDEGCKKVNEEVEIRVDQDAEGNAVVNVETDNFEEVEVVEKENEAELPADDINVNVEEECKELKEEVIEHEELEDVTINPDTSVEHDQKLEDPEEEPVMEERNEVSLQEDIENLSLDTETTHMEMTSDDNGKVVVVTEPREEEEVVEVEDEMIAPLTDEEQNELLGNSNIDLTDSGEDVVADEFDEFDEESFDDLGESFLHRIYENVKSFKTSSVSKNDNGNLVVEGLINFKSGKSKKTSFVFENIKTTKRGKLLLTGLNETFSASKKAFILKGKVDESNKLVSESLTYNYFVKTLNESGDNESIRIYGRAVNKK